MTSTFAIARKDWREFVRDRRLMAMSVIVALLALAALVTSYARVAAYEADRLTTEKSDRVTWESQGERNPHSVAHFATWALRPLTPLALVEPGVTPYAGSAVWMEAHSQNPARVRPVEDSATALDLGLFSIAWVLQFIVPLMIAVIAAGSVARERERGTLRLALAAGVPSARLARQKALGYTGIAVLLVVPLVIAGAVAAIGLGPVDPIRLILWVGAYGVFCAIVALVAVAVSVLSRTTSQAMLTLTALWMIAVLVAPRVGAAVGSAVAPTPTPDQFFVAMSEDMAKQPDVFGADADAFGAQMAKRYGVASIDDLPVSFAGLQLDEAERLGNLVFDRHYGRLAETYDRQRAVARWAGIISPLPALQNISMALAGTDMAHQLAFQRQAEQHRRELIGALNGDMVEHAKGSDWDYLAGPDLWRSTKSFAFAEPSRWLTLRTIWPDAAILLGWLIAAVIALSFAARRLTAGET